MRLTLGIEDQEIGARHILIVGRPDALATTRHRVIDHAAAGQRAIAEHIDHERFAATRGVFQAGTDTAAEIEIPRLAGRAITRMVVETAHLDGAGTGIAVDDHFHDGGSFAKISVAGVLGGGKYAARTDDVGVDIRIQRSRAIVGIGQIGGLGIAAGVDGLGSLIGDWIHKGLDLR